MRLVKAQLSLAAHARRFFFAPISDIVKIIPHHIEDAGVFLTRLDH